MPWISAPEDAILGGESLSDILSSLEDDILRVGLRTLVTEPLFGGIKAGLKGETLPDDGLGGLVSGGISRGVDAVKTFFGGDEEEATGGTEVFEVLKASAEAAAASVG